MHLGTEEERRKLEEQVEEKEERYANFLQTCQEKLDQYVKQVRLSTRLISSPVCLVAEDYEHSPNLERLLQKGKGGPKQRRIMELNAEHPIIVRLYERYNASVNDPAILESAELLLEMALIAEGSEVADPVRLSRIIFSVLQKML